MPSSLRIKFVGQFSILIERVISDKKEFLKLVERLSNERSIAVDLEFDKNRYRYGFTMCLMQLAVEDECFIVDPLSDDIDISMVFPIMENPEILKLAFEFGEDIRLFHHLGCKPKNVFDLSIATKLLDYSQVSLGSILAQLLDIETDKSSQKSNWFQRPLSDKQIRYAADDVRYLHQLESLLNERIVARKMNDWVMEEREVFENQNFESTESSNHFKTRDMDGMTEVEWFVFEQLIAFREELAEASNKPSYQVLDKDYLLTLAKNKSAISSFYMESKAPKKLLNEAFKVRLLDIIKRSKDKAIQSGLSMTSLVNPRLSKEEMEEIKAKKREKDTIVANTFKPIQQRIKEDFGDNAAVYLLGNKLMNELASGIYSNLRHYKRELILNYAQELKFNVSLPVN
jgi:ribonuclease D